LQHVVREERQNSNEKEIELFSKLSESLKMEILYEIHRPVLLRHPLFDHYAARNLDNMHKLCLAAIHSISLMHDDYVFSRGKVARDVYIVEHGAFTYTRRHVEKDVQAKDGAGSRSINNSKFGVGVHEGNRSNSLRSIKKKLSTHSVSGRSSDGIAAPGTLEAVRRYSDGSMTSDGEVLLSSGQWVCEAVLWTQWLNRGTMRAATEARVIALNAQKFHNVVQEHRTGLRDLLNYAQTAVDLMNEAEKEDISDLFMGFDIDDAVRRLGFEGLDQKRRRSRRISNADGIVPAHQPTVKLDWFKQLFKGADG
jgi:CRP-like cAMP-binding protein